MFGQRCTVSLLKTLILIPTLVIYRAITSTAQSEGKKMTCTNNGEKQHDTTKGTICGPWLVKVKS